MNLKRLILQGIFDTDPDTSLLSEVWGLITTPKGSYAKEINKVLKWQSEYRLGKYYKTSLGEVWTLIKSYKSKIANLEALTRSIQDLLSKKGTNRKVGFLFNPFQLILYYDKVKPISFLDNIELLESSSGINAFLVYEEKKLKVCRLDVHKEKFAHGLIVGITGSGKTVLMKSFILSLALTLNPEDGSIYILNPKNTKFDGFDDLPQLATGKIIIPLPEIDKQISLLHKELLTRLTKGAGKDIYIFVDELGLLSQDSKEKLKDIAISGRSLNMFLVLATQRPTKESIPTTLRSQLSYSLTGMVNNKQEAYFASGQPNSGAHQLSSSGSFIFNAPGYNNVLVQALMCEGEEKQIVERIRQKWPTQTKEVNEELPSYIASRLDWVKTIGAVDKLNLLQSSHKKFYGKSLNINTAKLINDWLRERGTT